MAITNVHGIQLNYESIRVEQPTSETILVFLHEALGSIPQWRSFPSELCNALQLNGIVYERQGYGKSSPLTEKRTAFYLHEYAQRELPELLETILPPDKKVILIGHSDGGTIALLYASLFPKRVLGLVTIAAHVINEPKTIAGIAPAVEAYKAGKLAKLSDFHGDKTDVLFYAWAETWNTPEFMIWDICKDIEGVQAPLLAIQGAKDQYGTKKQLELIQHHVKGRCDLKLMSDCGHHPHIEKPRDLIDLVKSWFVQLHT